jgi:hypothetical protein
MKSDHEIETAFRIWKFLAQLDRLLVERYFEEFSDMLEKENNQLGARHIVNINDSQL